VCVCRCAYWQFYDHLLRWSAKYNIDTDHLFLFITATKFFGQPVTRKIKRKQPRSIQEFNIYHKPNSHKKEMMVSVWPNHVAAVINKYCLFTLIVTEYCTISLFSVWHIPIYRTHKIAGEVICCVHVTEYQNWHNVKILTFH